MDTLLFNVDIKIAWLMALPRGMLFFLVSVHQLLHYRVMTYMYVPNPNPYHTEINIQTAIF